MVDRQTVSLIVPSSTSNLGPGLDTVGLALNIYSRMTFRVLGEEEADLEGSIVSLKGAIGEVSDPGDQSKLIYHLLKKIWEHNPELLARLRITIESDIPLGCGLGSSAANMLGALWASNVLEDRIPTAPQLLAEGCALEGHPETLAASLYGGLVICAPSIRGPRIVTQKLTWPDDWHILVLVPPYRLSTENMRAVLPERVSFKDAVFNSQRVGLLVAAVARADEAAMAEALVDKLHESYRMSFVPELKQLRRELVNEPIMGCVLSGAGSSVVVVVNERKKPQVLERLQQWTGEQRQSYNVLDLRAADEGMYQLEPH